MSGMRVSLDYNITSTVIDTSLGYGEKNLKLQGGVIEIKGKTLELPETLCRLKLLGTDWTRFSKYSSCLDVQMSEPCSSSRLWPTGRNILS
jgi:hypothetical protein